MNTENLAVVIGGTGSIGGAISEQIRSLGFKEIIKIGRRTNPSIDFNDEQTIKNAAEFIKNKKKAISILFDATGILPDEEKNQMPEKTYPNQTTL